jgi:hypothetical protein
MIEVTVEDTQVIVKLQKLSNMGEALRGGMVAAADRVRAEVSLYPPTSEANVPKPGHTHYVRGYGPVYVRVGASVSTYQNKAGRTAYKVTGGAKGRKTSQMLNRKWSTKYRFTASEAEAIIGNSATYAPYVHDDRKQASFHKVRGWRTAQGALLKFKEAIRNDFEQSVRAWLARS